MKTLHALKIELKKTIGNWGFLLSMVITFVLQFTNQVYIDDVTGKTYCVFEVMCKLDKGIIENNVALSSFSIIQGGLAVLLAYIMFAVVVFIAFPSLRSYPLSSEELKVYTVAFVTKRLSIIGLGMFLYGAVSTIPAFLMSSFVKNRYIITCVPFLLVYLYSTSLTKVIYEASERNQQKLVDLATALKPEQVASLHYADAIAKNAVLFNLGFVVIGFLLFVIVMNGRGDLGE